MNKREIKFRVWDKIMEDIAPLVELHSDWVAIPIMDEEGGHLEKRKIEDVELMQFTGLKDVNGVEIYEGDIIKKHYLLLGRVEYEDEIETINDIRNLPSYDLSKSEVIGNIYQHQELLQGLKEI